jgi:hypothetical protein
MSLSDPEVRIVREDTYKTGERIKKNTMAEER